jgi:hypothetical protein
MKSRNHHLPNSIFSALPVVLLVLGMSITVFHYANEIIAGGDPWKTGDWLINYHGGLIRRGMLGEVFLYVSQLIDFNLLWIVFLLQVGCYSVTTYIICKIYLVTPRVKEWAMLLLSPAFLLFAFYDYLGGFRKEIIAFAAFAILLHQYVYEQKSIAKVLLAEILFFIGCISHELIALTTPFFIYVTYLLKKNNLLIGPDAKYHYAFYLALSILALGVAIGFYGDTETVRAICESLIQNGLNPRICIGAIDSLSIRYTDEVLSKLGHFIWVYLPVFALALTPILVSNWYQVDRISFAVLTAAGLCLTPLFLVAYDWGRWVHIFVFFASALMLAQSVRIHIEFPQVPKAVLLFYLILWMVPTLYASGNTTNGFFWRFVSILKRLFG